MNDYIIYKGQLYSTNELYHHGVKGQKWGIRRYQNEDGTLTPAGIKRYKREQNKIISKGIETGARDRTKLINVNKELNSINRKMIKADESSKKSLQERKSLLENYRDDKRKSNELAIKNLEAIRKSVINKYGDKGINSISTTTLETGEIVVDSLTKALQAQIRNGGALGVMVGLAMEKSAYKRDVKKYAKSRSLSHDDELYHHGIKGQKWGVRRFQNKDGSLTPAGKLKYSKSDKTKEEMKKEASLGRRTSHDVGVGNCHNYDWDSLSINPNDINKSSSYWDTEGKTARRIVKEGEDMYLEVKAYQFLGTDEPYGLMYGTKKVKLDGEQSGTIEVDLSDVATVKCRDDIESIDCQNFPIKVDLPKDYKNCVTKTSSVDNKSYLDWTDDDKHADLRRYDNEPESDYIRPDANSIAKMILEARKQGPGSSVSKELDEIVRRDEIELYKQESKDTPYESTTRIGFSVAKVVKKKDTIATTVDKNGRKVHLTEEANDEIGLIKKKRSDDFDKITTYDDDARAQMQKRNSSLGDDAKQIQAIKNNPSNYATMKVGLNDWVPYYDGSMIKTIDGKWIPYDPKYDVPGKYRAIDFAKKR